MLIKMIKADKLKPHPMNPRQDLGDLTEMADSIRQNGILQNLTIVSDKKSDDSFFVVVGHKRRAAGLMAEVGEFPCEIKDLTDQEIIQYMMIENGQRNDLSPYEEAVGFQTMMDLGLTKKEIAKNTGFSVKTVNSRFKLLDLNQETLKDVSEEQEITIMDLAKLEKIKSKRRKNSVLKKIGTDNFDYEIQKAVREEKKEKEKRDFLKELSKYAKEISDDEVGKYKYEDVFFSYDSELPEDMDDNNYYYTINTYGSISLYRDFTDEDIQEEDKRDERDEKREELSLKLDGIIDTMKNARFEFIKSLGYKKQFDDMVKLSLANIVIGYEFSQYIYSFNVKRELKAIYGFEDDDVNGSYDYEELIDKLSKDKCYPLYIIYAVNESNICSVGLHNLFDDGEVSVNESLKHQYDFLMNVGYKLSDEEEQFLNGTHEIYADVSEYNGIEHIDQEDNEKKDVA